jgi:hypothetical protein
LNSNNEIKFRTTIRGNRGTEEYIKFQVTYDSKNKAFQPLVNHLKQEQLTSFLSSGVRKGSLTLSPATIVNMGSKQLKIAPNISILPSLGSIGSIVK